MSDGQLKITGQRFRGKDLEREISAWKVEIKISFDVVGKIKELVDKILSLYF